ncbi:DUF1876 domain-containing protein [Streptomyces sp. XD-27]|uniref:DUF1876 domain-containing protein n=1 Tax=Streptomyces sp. XD-27 TaxID=3062779 RepID=UPI0026F429BA|nr:DUF1876 domain-containing protein [Streptomyces sp. XD-27]WKX68817.1 DUF1876 domain-containing protein [Streptomyces sp. XD-27]
METIVGCNIEMEFHEIDATKTEAAVRVRLHDGTELKGYGVAHRHPDDPAQQRVGEEIAAARALTDLSKQLLDKAGVDIEEVTHVHADLVR